MNYDKTNNKLRAIGARMRNIRTIYGLRQKQTAEKLSISVSHYSKIEVGLAKASDSFLRKFCSVFGVNEGWLKNGEGSPLDDLQAAESAIQYEPLMKSRSETGYERQEMEKSLDPVIEAVIEVLKNNEMASITACAEKLNIPWEELMRTLLYSHLSEKLEIDLTAPEKRGGGMPYSS